MEQQETRLPHDIWSWSSRYDSLDPAPSSRALKWKTVHAPKHGDFTIETYMEWLSEARLVCKDFNDIVTPLWYACIRLDSDAKMEILIDGSEPWCSKIKANIIKYSWVLRVSLNPKPEFVALTSYIIGRCKQLQYFNWDCPDDGGGNPNTKAQMISTFVCSYLNGPSISKWRTFELHSDYAECMHLGSEFPYIAYEWPTKTSALLDLPSGSPGKEAQVARYRTKYDDEYDPFSATKPSSTSLHTVVLFGWSLNRFTGLVPCGKANRPPPKRFLVNGLEEYPNLVNLGLGLDVRNEDMYEYLAILARARGLRNLNLFATDLLGTNLASEASTDPDYDAATKIMKFIHAERRGKPFNMIKIDLVGAREPKYWRPRNDERFDDRGRDDYNRTSEREFMSRINAAGIYEQWGSERADGDTSWWFDNDSEDSDDDDDAEDSEYVVTDDEEQAVSAASG
ncbi:hypothetical protein BKA61DRAFT_727245 [Leptodontidium sp. MPI-SDFR-AT-0119]|nr:hypothetical protein BKA61DRAFT_727245 [Leptodontidium sp. MPI-SDFR-AT-0119]